METILKPSDTGLTLAKGQTTLTRILKAPMLTVWKSLVEGIAKSLARHFLAQVVELEGLDNWESLAQLKLYYQERYCVPLCSLVVFWLCSDLIGSDLCWTRTQAVTPILCPTS